MQDGNGISRRGFVGGTAGSLLANRFTGPASFAAATFLPRSAIAKPGGHRSTARECRSTFAIDYRGLREEITLYLAGTGYASFDNVYDYQAFNVREALFAPTVSMEWEVDVCFAGNRPDLGLVKCTTRVEHRGETRSGLILIGGDAEKGLFPATMINSIFVDLEFPAIGLRMFNKDPMLFRGETVNLDIEQIRADPRVIENVNGVPNLARTMLALNSEPDFNPIGFHALQSKNVEFFDRENPDERVAVLLEAEIQTLMNYGVEVSLLSAAIDREVVSVEWGISNLLWDSASPRELELVWYVEDSHDLQILGDKQGTVSLAGDTFRISVQAINTSTHLQLLQQPHQPDAPIVDQACIFCGAQNTPDSLDVRDFVAGFSYIDIGEIRRRL